ncbi:MAG TPA: TOBE domain-containing protein [Thermomicrobiales bacterium]|nr:TOBE domain-containing protein [Thermomicrobiales bacterium]
MTAISMGTVMAQATIDLGNGNEIIAAITVDFVERLGLEVGSEAIAIIKATEVMMATP